MAAWPLLIERQETRDVHRAFNEEYAALSSAIESLGIAHATTISTQCDLERTTYTQTEEICQVVAQYPVSLLALDDNATHAYPTRAAKLDALLAQRGWRPDRPQDKDHTLVSIDPFTPQNGSIGGALPLHKNIGPVSCNLEVDYHGPAEIGTPGVLDINEFVCGKRIVYPMLHIHARTYPLE
jgi:hypothetical protein